MYRKLILDGISALNDIEHYIPYCSPQSVDRFEESIDDILILREKLVREVPAPLIGLKAFTEGNASFERAGEISDLHIFGLRNYCEDRDVDWSALRIDEYYGVTDVTEIEENWEKLDPDHTMFPINFGGNSNYVKYGLLPQSVQETAMEKSFDNWISKRASLLVAEFGYKFSKVCEKFGDMYEQDMSELQSDSKTYLIKLSDGLMLRNSGELDYLETVLDKCYNDVYNGLESGNRELLIQCVEYLREKIRDEYYWFVFIKDEDYYSFFKKEE